MARIDQWDPDHPTERQIHILAAYGRQVRPETIAETQDLSLATVEKVLASALGTLWRDKYSREEARALALAYREAQKNAPPRPDEDDPEPEPVEESSEPMTTQILAPPVAVATKILAPPTATAADGEDVALAGLAAQLAAIGYAVEKMSDGFADVASQISRAAALADRLSAERSDVQDRMASLRTQVAKLVELVEG